MTDTNMHPPWIEYPGNDPWWGGWRQGTSETWLLKVWLPFWKNLTAEEKDAYLLRGPPRWQGDCGRAQN